MVTETKEAGKRVKFVRSSRSGMPVKPGETGLVWRITQSGTRRVLWDNGSRCDLDPRTDEWEIIHDED